VSGCYGYVTYVRRDSAGNVHVCLRAIVVGPCITGFADANTDGAVDAADPVWFQQSYAQGASAADVNMDGVLNAQDAADFLSGYSQLGPQ
jgi:hypothetical protein